MKSNEIVWRVLADAALAGQRAWNSIGDLAYKAGVPQSNAQFALQRLTEIGAVRRNPGGGFSTVNPEKIITLSCAWRSVERDTIARTSLTGLEGMLAAAEERVFLGGADAAVHHLGGRNTVAHISARIAYVVEGDSALDGLPGGEDVRILRVDPRALKDWDGYSSVTQTIADLFATPGWQASEFRLALVDRFLPRRDWDQEEAAHASNH